MEIALYFEERLKLYAIKEENSKRENQNNSN